MRFACPAILLALTLPLVSGCVQVRGGAAGIRVWAVPEGSMVFPDASPELENEVFSDAAGMIRLTGAVNEALSFQLVFSTQREPVSIWGVTVGDLRQKDRVIPAEQVRLYREARVAVSDYPAWYLRLTPLLRNPRQFADPLIPLTAPRGALPIDLEPGRCGAVWVELRVPPGTEPGLYRSAVRVTLQSGASRELELVLDVWPFALPQTRHLALIAGVETVQLLRHHAEVNGEAYAPARLSPGDPAYERATAVLDQTIQLLHDHRCSPMLRDVRPVRQVGVGGGLELDWADYDRLVAGLLEGSAFEDRAAVAVWPMPVDDREPAPAAYGGWASPAYERMLIDYLRACVAHFLERGWLDRHFVWIPLGGPTRGDRYRQFERLGGLIRQADTRLNLVCPLTPQSMAPYGWRGDPFVEVSEFVGVWCPPASLADADALARHRTAGKRTWLLPDRPPYAGSLSLIAPAVDARSIAWQAYRFGNDGALLPAVNAWPENGVPAGPGSERALIWPGKPYGLECPIPSIRLKRLLRGAQDYEYLWLLERNRRPGIARLVAADLFSYGGTGCYGEHFLEGRPHGWVSDPAAWALARRLMARELVAAMQEGQANQDTGGLEDVERFEQQIEWARLAETVRQMRARVEGVRVRFEPQDGTCPVRVEGVVSLFNATRQPFTGRLAFADLPEGWSAEQAATPIEQLKPLHGARRVLRAKAREILADPNGVLPIRIALTDGEGDSQTASGRLVALTSQRLTQPIAIDGQLDDWPHGITNVAGDFVLVGALEVPKRHRPSPDRPTQLTTVFVCDDQDHLYIAFNCEDDRLADRLITRSNYVAYDDLWPVGEDLVEVVLDPTNKAIGPGDLLHLVVKANGAVITKRGVPCLERVAPCTDWPAGAIAAIDDQSQPNRWTVEIRIPLESLGGNRAAVWGVNFARFHARLGEYASWSGAQCHVYSPATLGNMRLEP